MGTFPCFQDCECSPRDPNLLPISLLFLPESMNTSTQTSKALSTLLLKSYLLDGPPPWLEGYWKACEAMKAVVYCFSGEFWGDLWPRVGNRVGGMNFIIFLAPMEFFHMKKWLKDHRNPDCLSLMIVLPTTRTRFLWVSMLCRNWPHASSRCCKQTLVKGTAWNS